ncbi:hypothetical protein R5R35_003236 [Gryllus longicercus]|uniref:Accessory gland protein n=1 Tax=Gryllus longicercus TaxID=2509291 RepID=A0AAN9VKP5_9ORTH
MLSLAVLVAKSASISTVRILLPFNMLLLLLLPTLCFGHPRVATPLPDTAPSTPRTVNCSLLETLCLSQGKLLHDGDCYTPLETGSCSEHEWFVMNSDASAEGYCSSRPCAPREVPFQAHCLTQADARARLCQGDAVHLGPAGRPRCGPHPGWPALLAAHVQCSSSLQRKPLSSPSLSLSLSTPSEPNGRVVHSSGHNCGANDENECVLEVRGSSAAPELEAET